MKTKFTSVISYILLFNLIFSGAIKGQYFDDFEGANNGWSIAAIGANSSLWQLGTPAFGATTGAHSGTKAWDIDLNSAYANNSYAILNSPVFNFSNVVNATLTFWSNFNVEYSWDGARVEYSIDNGASWLVLDTSTGVNAVNWYNSNSLLSSNMPGWTGSSNSWQQSSISLAMFNNLSAPIQFRFVFTSDYAVVYDGFSIDDFSIDQVPAPTPGPLYTFNANAQQSSNPCAAAYNGSILMYGVATNFSNGDTLSINVNFGDGTDTTYNTVISNGFFFQDAYHFYATAGSFSLQYIINGPNGFSDTLVQYNQLSYSGCGSIEGYIFNDTNSDCMFDTTEVPLVNFQVELLQTGNFHSWAYTDATGKYSFLVPNGYNYTVQLDTVNGPAGYGYNCPAVPSYNVTAVPALGLNFATTCSNSFDLSAHLWSAGFAPGFNSYIHVTVENNSCSQVSGTATMILPNGVSYVMGIAGATYNGDTLQWNFNNLLNNSWNLIQVHVDSTLIIGDSLCFEIIVTPFTGDADTTNNTFHYCRIITGSLDPNEKIVEPIGIGSNGFVNPNTTFTYTVNFQNTGTAVAHNVSILDTLDADLDPSTLNILNATHPMTINYLVGNVLKFNFYNIMLLDSNANEPMSHGALQYTISTRPGLLQATTIKNTAYIYFDFNQPVITNTTLNTIDYTLSIADNVQGNILEIYPQPAADFFKINNGKLLNGELTIVDARGNICKKQNVTNDDVINIKDLTNGVYYIRIKANGSFYTEKLVVIK